MSLILIFNACSCQVSGLAEFKRAPSLTTLEKLIKERRFILAEDEVQKLLRQEPDNSAVHYAYGELLLITGQLDLASYEFKRANELSAKDPKPLIALCNLALQNLELNDALSYARRAVAANPASLQAKIALISALLKGEQTSAAEHEFSYLAKNDLDNPDIALLAYKLNLQKGDYQEAKQYLETALNKYDTQTPELLLDLADIYAVTGNYKKEKEILESINTANPFHSEARLKLARNLEFHSRDYHAAEEEYSEVLRLDPISAAATDGIERCRVKQNNIALRLKSAIREQLTKLFPPAQH